MKIFTLITLLLTITLNLFALQEREFYFIAKEERLGSISNNGIDKKGIYLRWDIVNGKLPSDIASITLERIENSTTKKLFSIPTNTNMSLAGIKTMLLKKERQRDLYKLIDGISRYDVGECTGANITNIAEKLQVCLLDEFWLLQTARSSFLVAQANNRAYLDEEYDATSTSITYRLKGINTTGDNSILLGEVIVKPNLTHMVLPAKNIQQLQESKCNDNKYALDDFRVGLSWNDGGSNQSELFVNSMMKSGYDLYFSSDKHMTKNQADAIDIRTLAQSVGHNADGEISLSSYKLKKINSALLTQAPYYEFQSRLKERGFKPGESYYYFLVAKDFTGNYGETANIKVTIPDLLPPPSPSRFRVIQKDTATLQTESTYHAELTFNSVSLVSYLEDHNNLRVCEIRNIAPNSRVHFVPKEESCDSDKGYDVNFNVANYYIYRFDVASQAAEFEDLDLDGYNDSDETESQQCNVASFPTTAKKYLVKVMQQSHEKRLSFVDMQVKKAKMYWYRVVSVTPSGIVSHMSSPVPVFISKRETLSRPKVSASYKKREIIKTNKSTIDIVVAEDKLSVSDKVILQFGGKSYTLPLSSGIATLTRELKGKLFERKPKGSLKVSFFKDVNLVLSDYYSVDDLFIFMPVYKEEIASDPIEPGGFLLPTLPGEGPKLLGYKISTVPKKMLLQESIVSIIGGESVPGGCIDLTFEKDFINLYKEKACLQTSLKIGNGRYMLEKDCNLRETKNICNESLNSEMVSVGVKFVLDNGTQTAESFINYAPLSLDTKEPSIPSISDLLLDKNSGTITVTLHSKLEHFSGVMVDVFKENSQEVFSQTFLQGVPLVIESIPFVEGESWCVKAKSIGSNTLLSQWSEPLCKEIEDANHPVTHLSWPNISNPLLETNYDLAVNYNNLTKQVSIRIAEENIPGTSNVYMQENLQEFSDVIAKDYVLSTAKRLQLEMIHEDSSGETLIKKIFIEKFFSSFILPKLAIAQRNVSQVNMLRFTFLDKDTQVVGAPLSIKKAEVLSYGDSKVTLSSSVFVSIQSNLTNRECIMTPLIDRITNYVVYRQELSPNPSVPAGKFVQVSPLIERSSCNENTYTYSNNLFFYTKNETQRVVLFIDRYPFEAEKRYRYIFLFFDKDGEPVSYSRTNPEVVGTH